MIQTNVGCIYSDIRISDLMVVKDWTEQLVTSRLLEYELWTRVHSRHLAATHGFAVRQVLAGISLVEMTPIVLARGLEPFPRPLRTMDALHLASLEYVRSGGVAVELASYDQRMIDVALALGIPVYNGLLST